MSNEEMQIIQTAELARATEVHRTIVTNASLAQQSIFEVGKGLKEMRDDKLYKHLGYDNFEQYCTNEIGLSKRQSYRYIGIVDKLGENVPPGAQNIGIMKLSMLADLSEEDREAVVESTDLEQISKRELESKIAQIKSEKEAAEKAAKDKSDSLDMAEKRIQSMQEQLDAINAELQAEKEKPVEVAVDAETAKENEVLREQLATAEKTAGEAQKLKAALDKEKEAGAKQKELYDQTTVAHAEELKALKAQYEKELEQAKKEYEEQLANAAKPEEVAIEVPDIKEMFKVHLRCTIDAAKNMLAYLAEHPDETLKEQARKSLTAISEQI